MQPKARPKKFSAKPEIPRIQDRLPILIKILASLSFEMAQANPRQSYIPYWEELYAEVHGIKGCLGILECAPSLKAFLLEFDSLLGEGLDGESLYRDLSICSDYFKQLTTLLGTEIFSSTWKKAAHDWCGKFNGIATQDLQHSQRMKSVSASISHISDSVSKKIREVELLQLSSCLITEEISLEEIPEWKNRLKTCLIKNENSRTIAVNVLPLLKDDVNSNIEMWCWVANQQSEKELCEQMRTAFPKGKIQKINWKI